MSDFMLGIDVGSTSVKAAVVAQDGLAHAQFCESYPTTRPSAGVAEQDPDDWVRLIGKALAAFSEKGLSGRVGFGGLTSQVNTHVFVDKDGVPLMPAILWQDLRAIREAAELDAQLTEAQKISLLGAPIPIDASHPLARMLWVARHRPQIWANTAHVLLPKDYCLLKLTGRATTDPLSNIGLVGTDLTYVPEILDLVPGAAQRMAPLTGLTDEAGVILPSFSLAGVRMIECTMDGWVGLLGGGASRDGKSVYLSGTSEILGISSHNINPTPGVIVFAQAEGLRLHAGPTQSGGASQLWFGDLAGKTVEELGQLVAKTPRRAPTPLFLPQLAGERAPLWNPDLRGAFLGLDSGMKTVDLARAVFEGVAFSARHVLQVLEQSAGIQNDTLTCGGGGFQSDAWGQIRADVLGRQLTRLAVNEPGLMGAVCLAGVGGGVFDTLSDAHDAFVSYDKTWEPDQSRRALYDDLFGLYLQAIETNADLQACLTRVQ